MTSMGGKPIINWLQRKHEGNLHSFNDKFRPTLDTQWQNKCNKIQQTDTKKHAIKGKKAKQKTKKIMFIYMFICAIALDKFIS